jgi:hypothetical protein
MKVNLRMDQKMEKVSNAFIMGMFIMANISMDSLRVMDNILGKINQVTKDNSNKD